MFVKYLEYKKKGRTIHAPSKELKAYQRSFLSYLQSLYSPPSVVHGYIAGRSYITAAKEHIGAKYVLRLDIQKFFNSITFSQIVQVSNTEVAVAVCAIIDSNRVLVQGSPLSPILSNMVLQTFDNRLSALAKSFDCSVTRYADDIVISSKNPFPFEKMTNLVENLLSTNGFKLNKAKTKHSVGDYHTIYGINVGPTSIKPARILRRKARNAQNDRLAGFKSLFEAIK